MTLLDSHRFVYLCNMTASNISPECVITICFIVYILIFTLVSWSSHHICIGHAKYKSGKENPEAKEENNMDRHHWVLRQLFHFINFAVMVICQSSEIKTNCHN